MESARPTLWPDARLLEEGPITVSEVLLVVLLSSAVRMGGKPDARAMMIRRCEAELEPEHL